MSKIVISVEDKSVMIDGESINDLAVGFPANIDIIHWDTVTQKGTIERRGKEEEIITNFAPYQHLIDAHGVEKAAIAQKILDDQAAFEASLTQQQRRDREYPPGEDQLSALHYARGGDPAPLTAIDTAMDAVDLLYPL